MAERGFTLLEMMISLAVFMVGLAGVVSLQVASSHGVATANEITLATNIAAAKLEQLNVTSFDALADGTETYNKQGAFDGTSPYFTVTWSVAGLDIKDLTVAVAWSMGAANHSIALASRRAR